MSDKCENCYNCKHWEDLDFVGYGICPFDKPFNRSNPEVAYNLKHKCHCPEHFAYRYKEDK